MTMGQVLTSLIHMCHQIRWAQYATVSETLWHGNKSAEVKVVVESEGVSLCFQRVGNQRVCRTQNRVQMCVQCM